MSGILIKGPQSRDKSAEIVAPCSTATCSQVGNVPMSSADEMAAKIAGINRQSVGPASDPDDMLRELDQRLRATLKVVRRTSNQPKPVEDLRSDNKSDKQPEDFPHTNHQTKPVEELHSDEKLNDKPKDSPHTNHQAKPVKDLPPLIPRISDRLDDDSSDRVRAVRSQPKGRASPGFSRYPVAICVGVAGTLAWQAYGAATKQIIAAIAPALVAPDAAAPKAPAAPSLDQQQVQQMVQSLAALRQSVQQLAARQENLSTLAQTVDQLATGQDQMVRKIDMLQSANLEILDKIPASSRQPPVASARKPKPVLTSSSRAPIPSPQPQSVEPIPPPPPPADAIPRPPQPIPPQATPDQ
ncbi:MAG: hypothetical protein WA728_12330 [Xanthobacteraceae bacterium]